LPNLCAPAGAPTFRSGMVGAGEHFTRANHIVGAAFAQKCADLFHDGADATGKTLLPIIVARIGLAATTHGWFVTHVADS
jgi:hypothetical protein